MAPLQTFIDSMTRLVETPGKEEPELLDEVENLLRQLIATDDWLPEKFARPDPVSYRQNLLYCDPASRFCVTSFVWGPGQTTPVHDHWVWGLVGVLRGEEICEEFEQDGVALPLRRCASHRLHRGEIDRVSPRLGDIHRVSNGLSDGVSVSIHIYGGDIGRISRYVYDEATGIRRPFVSGYSNVPA